MAVVFEWEHLAAWADIVYVARCYGRKKMSQGGRHRGEAEGV